MVRRLDTVHIEATATSSPFGRVGAPPPPPQTCPLHRALTLTNPKCPLLSGKATPPGNAAEGETRSCSGGRARAKNSKRKKKKKKNKKKARSRGEERKGKAPIIRAWYA